MTLTIIFYFAIVVFAIFLLTAVQLRSSGGAAFDTWRLNYDANRLLAGDQTQALRSKQEEARKNMDPLFFVRNCLRLFDKNGIPQAKLIDSETAQEVKKAKDKHIPIENLKGEGDVYCLVRGFASLEYDRAYYEMIDKDYSFEIEELKKSLASNSEQYAELIKGQQDFIAFRSMASVWYEKPFFTSPYDLLVLLLVMMMGAIGGVVRLLRDYGSSIHPDPSSKDYLFIPLIGSVVAIGGYVLAKTGLLLLSSTQSETSLSPFMIGLVGIISGLLATEVIETIESSGRKILGRSVTGAHEGSGQTEVDAQAAAPTGGSSEQGGPPRETNSVLKPR
jgi:hypothetical protein